MTIKRRKQGLVEHFTTCRKLLDYYKCFVFIAKYNIDLNRGDVCSALKTLFKEFTLLTCTFNVETLELQNVPKIKFDDVVSYVDESKDYDELLTQYNLYDFELNTDKPLFKLFIYSDNKVVLVMEHALFDGGSGFNFFKHFLKCLNNSDSPDVNTELFDSGSTMPKDIPLPVDKIINFEPTWTYKFKKSLKSFLPLGWKSILIDHDYTREISFEKWHHQRVNLGLEEFTKCFEFNLEEADKILTACRANKVTVTPFLEIILLMTIRESLSIADDKFLDIFVPINLRNRISEELKDDYEFGIVYYFGCTDKVPTNELAQASDDRETFWKLCKDSHHLINSTAMDPNLVMNFGYGFNKYFSPDSTHLMSQLMQQNYAKGQGANTRISNLGVFKSDTGKYEIENIVFGQNVGINGGCSILNVISVANRGMSLSFSCSSEIANELQKLEEFCKLFKQRVLSYV